MFIVTFAFERTYSFSADVTV